MGTDLHLEFGKSDELGIIPCRREYNIKTDFRVSMRDSIAFLSGDIVHRRMM